MRRGFSAAVATISSGLLSLSAAAADLPQANLKMAGQDSTQNMHTDLLATYFGEEITNKSEGAITVELTPSDVLGLQGTETVRLVGMGVLDMATGALSYMAGDDPQFEGMDLPGLTLDIKKQREVAEAYFPVIADSVSRTHNVKLLALYPIGLEVWYCQGEFGGLGDVEGKKVRVYNRTMADFVEAAGGTTVNIPFAEVVPALHRGVADCAVTGTSSGNTARWWEVTNTLYNLPMGWAMQYFVISNDTWNRLDPAVQEFLISEFEALNDEMWALMERDIQDGIDCNLGKACGNGIEADPAMTLLPVSEADMAEHRRIMEEAVIAEWAKRCGPECAGRWNETVGKVVGLEAPAE